MQQVTYTSEGVYLVHDARQRPVEGVAVWHYGRSLIWECERCGAPSGTTRPDCSHIVLAKKELECGAWALGKGRRSNDSSDQDYPKGC